MEDFGQLIAIIVGIVFLVINSLSKKKKPTSQPQGKNNSSPKIPRTKTGIPELDVLLEEFSKPEEDIENTYQEVEPAYESLETLEPNSPYAEYNSIDLESENIKYDKLQNQEMEAPVNYFESEPKTRKTTNDFDFDLRNAVVFSEILKRPSY